MNLPPPLPPREQAPPAGVALIAAAAAAAVLVSCLIAWRVLDGVPHVTDAVSYLFAGRTLAAGELYLKPPPLPFLFGHENILITATRWCSIYPPGWPLLLALGWWIKVPWLICPLLLGLAVVAAGLAGRRLYGGVTGAIAAVAVAVSPFALLMAGDALAHVPALCTTLWTVAELAAGVGKGRSRDRHLLLAGASAGLSFLIRPVTALALLAPWALWGLVALWRQRRLRSLVWVAAGLVPWLAVLALYNARVFGSPFESGYALYDPQHFGSMGGMTEPPGVALLRNLPWYLRHLNGCLWGFPWGDLVFLLPVLAARPRRLADGLLAASAAGLILVHCFYAYGDVIYSGPRFAFEALGPFSLLAARSVLVLWRWVEMGVERLAGAGRRTARLLVGGALVALLLYAPLGRRLPAQILDHAQWYLAQSGDPLRAGLEAGLGPEALVFVAGSSWCYSSLFLANSLEPARSGRVFVRDVPPLRRATMMAFPRPETWIATVVVTLDPRRPDHATPREVHWQRVR